MFVPYCKHISAGQSWQLYEPSAHLGIAVWHQESDRASLGQHGLTSLSALCKACNLPGHTKVGAGQRNHRGQSACPAGVSTPTVSCLAIQRMSLLSDWRWRHPGAVFMFCCFLATNLHNLMLTRMCCHVTGHVIPDYIWLLGSKPIIWLISDTCEVSLRSVLGHFNS